MEIISHRGYWKSTKDKNSYEAFVNSFENNIGTETDIRDFENKLVVSHDIPNKLSIDIDIFFELYVKYPQKTLALNIKSDGLSKLLKEKLNRYNINNYFVFDMSIPDSMSYINNSINFFMRQSEVESDMFFYDQCKGIWLDSFYTDWFTNDLIEMHINNNKKVCIVSPELHNRDHLLMWSNLKKLKSIKSENIILCTDFPINAINYFNI